LSSEKEAEALNSAIKDPVPELQEGESTLVTLQRGLMDPATGMWQVEAEVREMNGADEEYMSGLESKADLTYGEYISALLKRAVVRVGVIPLELDKNPLDNLSIGDRDILFLGVIRATYGKSKEFQAVCRACESSNDVVVDLNEDFPIKKPSVDLRNPITLKLKNNKVVNLRVPTMGDNAHVSKVAKSVAAQNTLMISRCSVWPEGNQPADLDEWAKNLNVADRNKIVKSLLEIEAGPDLKAVNVQCASCGEEMTIALDWVSLLLV
jgi:hypothetical protein